MRYDDIFSKVPISRKRREINETRSELLGLNRGSSLLRGYNPSTGLITTPFFILMEDGFYLLQENGDKLIIDHV